jgi:hypothetical protein
MCVTNFYSHVSDSLFEQLLQDVYIFSDAKLCSRGLVLYSGKYSYMIFCLKNYQVMWELIGSVYMSWFQIIIMLLFHVLRILFVKEGWR